MGRYSKLNSSYILREQHQTIDGGVILERDWTTIGERSNINKGKKRVSYDGNFLFTENTESMGYRKALSGRWVGSFNYDDVKDASDVVNKVKLNTTTNDPLVFSYYGSSYDQYEGAIINIIKEFPGKIVFGDILFQPGIKDYSFPNNLSELKNDFEINLISAPTNLESYENRMRYMKLSWQNYVISVNGVEKPITDYVVKNKQNDIWDVQRIYTGTGELYKYNDKYYKYDKSTGQYIEIDVAESDNYFVKCNEYIKHKDSYYKWSDENHMYKELPIEKVCEPKVYEMFEVTFFSDEEEYKIHIYRNYKWINYTNEMYYDENGNLLSIEIKPKDEIIEKYFSGLTGIEANMLNRKSNPNYSFNIITCTKNDFGNTVKQSKILSWPKNDDYTIKVNGTQFDMFVNELLTSAELYDENFSDNIWRNMTHESIKNYDWSYEKNGEENDLLENEIGLNKVSNILRLIGMQFDEIKLYVNGITASNKLTYDGFLNMPDSEIVNELEISGFDTNSTIWHQDEYIAINENEIPENTVVNNYFTIPSTESVLDDYISVGCEEGESGIQYYKRVSTLGNEVRLDYAFFNSGNESVVGKKNPWIKENSSGYSYKRISYAPSVLNQYWNDSNTFDSVPTIGTRFSPKYVRVYNVDGYEYYEKVQSFDSDNFIHENWYEKIDPNYFTQSIVDIDFMKRLGLSAKNMFATKGTAHSIDMIMGVFGFGRENDLQNSDYQIIEPYHQLNPRQTDEEFYYYEPLENAPSGVTYGTNATFLTLPLHANSNNTMFPENIRVDDGSNGYYYFVKKHSKTIDAATRIFSKIIPVTYDGKSFSGFPLSTTVIDEKEYLIPYMSDKYSFYGDVYFQSKGGWCKNSEINSGKYDYLETVPYIKSTNSVNGLIGMDSSSISVGDYIYVKYPLYQSEDFGVNQNHVSNYFKLVSSDVTDPHSWRNIPISGPIEFDNYIPITDDQFEPTHEDYLNVKFIDEIVFTNKGNNPHCGNGEYDGGDEYISYMKLPFKYAVENPETMFSDNVALCIAKQFVFNVSSFKYDFVKAYCHNNTFTYENLVNEPNVDGTYWTSQNTFDSVPVNIYTSSPELIRIKQSDDTYKFYKRVKLADSIEPYFLNSKVVIMRNLLNNNLYRRYFNSIIKPYLLQLIPSTTIFVFEGYNECETNNGIYYNIQVQSIGCGVATGGGRYFECDHARLVAEPNQGCHFVEWQLIDCETEAVIQTEMDMSTEIITPKVVGDACYRAVFEENCVYTFINGHNICEDMFYRDGKYGRIYYNGKQNMERFHGINYNVDSEVGPFYFTSEPFPGYLSNGWTIFDGDGVDITNALVVAQAITLSTTHDRIDILIKSLLCNCEICANFTPIEYDINYSIQCNCNDSYASIDTRICNPVTLSFECNQGAVCCSDMIYHVYVAGFGSYEVGNGEHVIVEKGVNVIIDLEINNQCCQSGGIVRGGIDRPCPDAFVANADATIKGKSTQRAVSLNFEYAGCNLKTDIFYTKDLQNQTAITSCYCGDKIYLIVKETCQKLIPNEVYINGNKTTLTIGLTQTYYYAEIQNVASDIITSIKYDIAAIKPTFGKLVDNVGQEIENCEYETVFKKEDVYQCNFGIVFYFKNESCTCECEYKFAKWEIKNVNNVWETFGVSADLSIDVGDYIALIKERNCKVPEIRPVAEERQKTLTFTLTGGCQTSNIRVTIYNDSKTSITALDINQKYTIQASNIPVYFTVSNNSQCCEIKSISMTSPTTCMNIQMSSEGYQFVGDFCGDTVINIVSKKVNDFDLSVTFYDYETNLILIDADICVTTLFNNEKTYTGNFTDKLKCGSSNSIILTNKTTGCCGNMVSLSDQANAQTYPTIVSIQTQTSYTHNFTGSDDHDIRVYIQKQKYTIDIYYMPFSTECQNDLITNCLKIRCVNALDCHDVTSELVLTKSVCEYKCGDYVSFVKDLFCDSSGENDRRCCQNIFDVISGESNKKGFEFGKSTSFNTSSKTWTTSPEIETDDINDVILSGITENYTLVVNYDCTDRETSAQTNLTVHPVLKNTNNEYVIISDDDIPECMIFRKYDINPTTFKASCQTKYRFESETNECYEFKGYLDATDNSNIHLCETNNAYELSVCDEKVIYAWFEKKSDAEHTIEVSMFVREQNFSLYNSSMHTDTSGMDAAYANQSEVTIVETGSCGDKKRFTFVNKNTNYFSLNGLYRYDEIYNQWVPCLNIDIEVESLVNNREQYTVDIKSCESCRYALILVPNDYITFYNPDYIDGPSKNVYITYGFYNNGTLVAPTSGYELDKCRYWNGTAWTGFTYNQGLYTSSSMPNFLMVRINTKTLNNVKLGNYCKDSNDIICNAKIKTYIGNNIDKYSISGSILSLGFYNDGISEQNLPDNFAKEIFYTQPENIFGYAFRNIKKVGDYGLYKTLSNTSSDFLMLDKIEEIGEYGCYQTFYNTSISGVSLEKLKTVQDNGCYGMFTRCASILHDIDLNNLESVGKYGCYEMFYNADGSYTSLFVQQLYSINVSFGRLSDVDNYSFAYMFYGCNRLEMIVEFTHNTLNVSNTSNAFYDMFAYSAVKEVDFGGITYSGLSANKSQFDSCFVNCGTLSSITVSDSFKFFDPSTTTSPTRNWLNVSQPSSSFVFHCGTGCSSYIGGGTLGRSVDTVPQYAGWSIDDN